MKHVETESFSGSKGFIRIIQVCLLSVVPLVPASPAKASESLTVRVEGLSTLAGHVRIAIFDNADAFPDDERALQRDAIPVGDQPEVLWVVDGLTPGEYGIAVFHDIDDDEVMDTNFVGLPKEPYGFSNDARGRFGPPTFEAAAFAFEGQAMTISIEAK